MIINRFESWWVRRDKCLFDDKRKGKSAMDWDVLVIKLTTDTGIEGEIHLALLHIGHIVKGCLHRVAATHLVGNGLVVAHDFLALEGSAFALSDLSIAIAQLRDHRHHSFRLHIFHGEVTIDGSRNLAA